MWSDFYQKHESIFKQKGINVISEFYLYKDSL